MAHARKRTWNSPDSGSRKANGRKAGESWEARFKVEGKWRKKAGFKTKAEAEAHALDQESRARAGIARPNGEKITLEGFAAEFFPYQEARLKRDVITRAHVRNMQGHFRNYISRRNDWAPYNLGGRVREFEGGIGHLKLSEIRPRHIEKFRDDLLEVGLNEQTVRAILTSLHIMFDLARRRDYIATNPADKIKIEIPRGARGDRRYPPPKESVAACLAVAPDPLKLVLQMAASSGLRAGELRALRQCHINLVEKTVRVEFSANSWNEVGPPKSPAGYRSVPISDPLLDRLVTYRRQLGSWRPTDLVFPTESGGVVGDGYWLKQLYKLFDELGWPGKGRTSSRAAIRFNMHELRHYAISSWIAADLGLKAVQTFAGHADIRITWNRYGHLFPDERHHEKINVAAGAVFS
jgi:integrase